MQPPQAIPTPFLLTNGGRLPHPCPLFPVHQQRPSTRCRLKGRAMLLHPPNGPLPCTVLGCVRIVSRLLLSGTGAGVGGGSEGQNSTQNRPPISASFDKFSFFSLRKRCWTWGWGVGVGLVGVYQGPNRPARGFPLQWPGHELVHGRRPCATEHVLPLGKWPRFGNRTRGRRPCVRKGQ